MIGSLCRVARGAWGRLAGMLTPAAHVTRRRRKGALPQQEPARAPIDLLAASNLPQGSRRIGPTQRGDQGISASERPHAEVAIRRLFEAPGVDMVANYDAATNTYELRSRTGSLRWERWATPSGDLRYVIVERQGTVPITNVARDVAETIEEERAAAGGRLRAVPTERNAYPDILQRLTQLFDHRRAGDFVYIPRPGADPNHPGGGSHGIPDAVQSRAPLVIAGPGIARGAVVDRAFRHEDLAPTLAQLLGVQPIVGTSASGVQRLQWLRWQDGRSQAAALVDARAGTNPWGSAARAVVFTIDGLSQTALLDEVARGTLPNLRRILDSGTRYKSGSLAEYPTVTWANHNTLMTGAAPGHSGIVNNSWYDRERGAEQLITDGGVRNSLRTGRFLEPQVETLYEAVGRSFPRGSARTVAINQPSGRGADVSVLDLRGIGNILLHAPRAAAAYLAGWRSRDRDMRDEPQWKKNAPMDLLATSLGVAYLGSKRPPRLTVMELTLVDNQGHFHGPHSEAARRALRAVDRQVGQVLAAIDRRGLADSTAIVLTADHGMETQDTDEAQSGGWFEALDRARVDGVETVESTRFVYVRNLRWQLVSGAPRAGAPGDLVVRVGDDDVDAAGVPKPIAAAEVVVVDADGHRWSGHTGPDGVVRVRIDPTRGPLRLEIRRAGFSLERGTVALEA